MKKQCVPALVILALNMVVIIGSRSFLSPCIHDDGSFGACHWAGRTLMGLGCVAAVLAALSLCMGRARPGIYLSLAFVCALGGLTPGFLIDLCRMSTMRCRMVMQPAMMILFFLSSVCALTGAVLCARDAG
jgi:hypothetical protein